MIEDDPEIGMVDDYVGPGVFVSLAVIVLAIIAVVKLGMMVFS